MVRGVEGDFMTLIGWLFITVICQYMFFFTFSHVGLIIFDKLRPSSPSFRLDSRSKCKKIQETKAKSDERNLWQE